MTPPVRFIDAIKRGDKKSGLIVFQKQEQQDAHELFLVGVYFKSYLQIIFEIILVVSICVGFD
jgi:hypothetical protein